MIELFDILHHFFGGKVGGPPPSFVAHPGSQAGILEELKERVSKSVRVLRGNKQPIQAMRDSLGISIHVRADDRLARCHGLWDHSWQPLPQRSQDKHI